MPASDDARLRAEVAEFLSSPHGEPFASDPLGTGEVARTFLEICRQQLGARVELLDEEHLRDALLELLPRRLAPRERASAEAPAIVRALLAWAHELHPNPNSWKLDGLLDDLEPQWPGRLKAIGGTAVAAATAPITRHASKLGRNDPCPCGSGKKWKKCCGAES